MVKLRMTCLGRGNRKTYRFMADDMRKRRDGRGQQFLGYYDPFKKTDKLRIDEEAVYAWLKKGAEPSDTFRSMLKKAGIWAKWMLLQQGKDVTGLALQPKAVKGKRKKNRDKGEAVAPVAAAPAAATA
ncbi:MAG: 30S ribosomal protein S16 [Fibrobacterota bacterium]